MGNAEGGIKKDEVWGRLGKKEIGRDGGARSLFAAPNIGRLIT